MPFDFDESLNKFIGSDTYWENYWEYYDQCNSKFLENEEKIKLQNEVIKLKNEEREGLLRQFDLDKCNNEYIGNIHDYSTGRLAPEYDLHKKRCEDVERCYRKYTKAHFDQETKNYTLDYKNYIKTCDEKKTCD